MTTEKEDVSDRNLGVTLSALKVGTKLFIETKNSFYDLEMLGEGFLTIFGGTVVGGALRFPKPTRVLLVGSFARGVKIMDWLGLDMKLEFLDLETEKRINTSKIRSIQLESADGDWSYRLE